MEQLSLFASPDQDVIADAEYPTSYRIERNGSFVVTANVPGVGRITSRGRFLWETYQDCRTRIAHALQSRPDAMF
jgi:hypothetical protein